MSEASNSIMNTYAIQITTTYDDEFMGCKRSTEHPFIMVNNNNSKVCDDDDLSSLSESPESPESLESLESRESPIENNPNMPLHRNRALVENLVDTSELIIDTIWTNFPVHLSAHVIPLRLFIREILRRSRTSWSTLQTTLFYLLRIKPMIASLTFNPSGDDGKGCDPATCGRRMFLASLIVASKYLQDRNYANNAWSKISGLPLQEINTIERRFLKLIRYDLYISEAMFKHWVKLLLSHIHITSGSAVRQDALRSEENQKAAAQFKQTLWMPRSQTECSVRG